MSLKRAGLSKGVSLREYTAIRIGGEARYFFSARDLDDLGGVAGKTDSFYLLGGGSNLLIEDKLIDKPVIKLGKRFNYIKRNGGLIEAGAATSLPCLLSFSLRNNLEGLENLGGIPASVGGAVVMNASSFGKSISQAIEKIEVMDRKGGISCLKKEDVVFGYRSSSLKGYIVLRVWFKLREGRDVKGRFNIFFQQRQSSQDLRFLIDSCQLKGLRENGAAVSSKHANFIINLGGARYKDVDYLISTVKERVYRKFHILLKEEIERWH